MLLISGVKLLAIRAGFEPATPTYGASALAVAVLALFACAAPYERVNVIVSIPVWLFVTLIVGYEVFTAVSNQFDAVGPTAYLTAAGFAVAYYFSGLLLSNALFPRGLSRPARRARRPALHLAEEPLDIVARPVEVVKPRRARDEQLEAKLDQILEKIARVGKAGLTDEEQDVLKRASELFKGPPGR